MPTPDPLGAEWLLADGLGGYAMGTPALLRTRRYHSLLTRRDPDGSQHAVLLGLDPVLVIEGCRHDLAMREWADGRLTGGAGSRDFSMVEGVPRWRWQVAGVVLECELALARGANHLAAVYRLAEGAARLEVELILPVRNGDGSTFVPSVRARANTAGRHESGTVPFLQSSHLLGGVRYREDAARGLPETEDVLVAGRFVANLVAGESVELLVGEGPVDARPRQLVAAARARYADLARSAGARGGAEAMLVHAADQFVIAGPDVIAGYPWFGCWSRDTLTAYEGLFLITQRWDEGAALLRRLAASVDAGQLVNTTDFGGGEHNTADAAMWLLYAAGRHWEVTGDATIAADLLPGLQAVVDGYRCGTRFGIRVDADGLVTQGADGFALTWMDARVDGVAITPRIGKPVEVNALWVAGLWYLAAMQAALGVEAGATRQLHQRARVAFARFVAPQGLFDVIDGPYGDDASLRPNQLLAGVRHGPFARDSGGGAEGRIEPAMAEHIAAAAASLITPLGPRSLGRNQPGYASRFDGDMRRRDSVYHQGTVWPWLIGAWAEVATAAGRTLELDGLIAHLHHAGLGSVTEVADAEAPHHPGGCPFQAWSVAELLRALRTR